MEEERRTRCECVVWRDGERRCELWMIDGIAHLRVFAGERLIMQELADRKSGYARAEELRQETQTLDGSPVPPPTTPEDTEGG
jgi:hypothetical protein